MPYRRRSPRRALREDRRSLLTVVGATVALLASLLVATPASATATSSVAAPSAVVGTGIVQAAAVVGFNPENIISDALFYDGAAMTSAQIQSFLDARIGT